MKVLKNREKWFINSDVIKATSTPGLIEKVKKQNRFVDIMLDCIIYGSFLTMILWGILKGIGVIHTPALIEQIPLITGGLGLFGFAYKIGAYFERIEQRLTRHDLQFQHVDKDLEFLKQRI